ncbi:MAG: glycosyltransferase family 87 protein [Actinomycetota bacterium]
MPTPARRFGLGMVFVCLTATLTLGLVQKSPCIGGNWSDGRQYTRLCYTDIVPLLGTEQLTGDRLPYLDPCDAAAPGNCDEYPVLSMWAMRAAAWISGPDVGDFFRANFVILTLAAFATALCLYLMVGGRALYFALAPTLLIYAYVNWDLLAVAFATASTLLYLRRRDTWAGLMIGLGAAAKLYPLLLLVPFVAGRFRSREPDRGIHLTWAAAGAWVVVNLPFALASPTSWWEFFRFNSARPADWDSIWFIACHRLSGEVSSCGNTRVLNLVSALLFVALASVVWRAKVVRDPGFARWTLGFPLLVLFLLTNKVYSPQYGLWLLPWFALALPEFRLFVAFQAADVAVFVTRFSWFGELSGVGGLPIGAFEIAVMIRTVILVVCILAWVRRREPVPVPAPPAEPQLVGAPA